MSKKLDAIKKAVFFAEQNPGALAEIIAGTVSDVATSIEIAGPTKITIPSGDTANTADYTATVFSQFGDVMSGTTATLSLKESATGVSIEDGTVSVAKTASAGTLVVKAVVDTLSAEYSVELVAEA